MLINPFSLLRFAAPGTTCLIRQESGGGWQLVWFIREESDWVEQLGSQPDVEFRAELFSVGGVGLLPLLVRVGPISNRNVYEAWVDVHAPGQGETLATLAEQSSLEVNLYVDEGRLGRSLVIDNGLGNFARQALAEIAARPAWTVEEFDRACQQLREQYPEPWGLWQAIGQEKA